MDVMELMTALMLYCGGGSSTQGDCKRFMTACAKAEVGRWNPTEAKVFFECTDRYEQGYPSTGAKKREVIR